jgi:hypothetical protein
VNFPRTRLPRSSSSKDARTPLVGVARRVPRKLTYSLSPAAPLATRKIKKKCLN